MSTTETAAERVAQAIGRLIDERELTAGDELREAALAERFGTSRHTVRAAIHLLESDGVVTQERHRSARVRTLTVEDVRDLFDLRRLVELEAVRRTIAADAPLAALAAIVDEIDALEAGRTDDRPGTAEIDADVAFHRALLAIAGSPRMERLFGSLLGELRLAFVALGDAPSDHGEHRRMLDAIVARDEAAATRLLDLHLRDGLRVCLAAAGRQ